MKKRVLAMCLLSLSACGPNQQNSSAQQSDELVLNDGQNADTFKPLEMVAVQLGVQNLGHDVGILSNPTITVDISCDDVYGPVSGDWSVTDVAVTSATDFTIDVPLGYACYVTLDSYFDGTNTFTPVGDSLVIDISSSGVVSPASAQEYSNGGDPPIDSGFSAASGGAWTINISSAAISTSETTSTSLTEQDVTINVAAVDPPSVTDLTLFTTPAMNGQDESYTITAAVTGVTGCKYIDTTTYGSVPASYADIATAYADVTAVTCPSDFIDGVGQEGNWTTQYNSGDDFLIMWVNTVGGVSAYTTATEGP